MSNAEILKKTADVRLSLSDWLALAGWCSAHVNNSTPNVIVASLREMSRQIVAGGEE